MTGPEIIKEIIKINQNNLFDFENFCIRTDSILYREIINNFKLYGNTPISDIDEKHIWLEKNNNVGISLPISDIKTNTSQKYIYAIKYLCKKTNSIGYTFQYKSYIIKPFLVINHD